MKKMICLLVIVLGLVGLYGCTDYSKVIRVGATTTPHAEILEVCREYVESQGYTLKIVEFTDYKVINAAVSDKSLDANFFQHVPYMEDYNAKNKGKLVSVLPVHFEPLGIYAGKSTSLENINSGATIAIPSDETNCARALLLLEYLGLIGFEGDKGLNVVVKDIKTNPHNLVIVELSSEQLAAQLPDFDYAVINGNYAINGNVLNKLLASEPVDGIAATTYANVVAVLEKNKESDKTKVLIEALKQPAIREFITTTYQSTVIPFN